MHYIGMTAQVGDMEIEWIGGVIFASVVIAAVVATVAFWIMFRLLSLNPSIESLRVSSALVMGIAACGMHYTGMHAAVYHRTTVAKSITSTISTTDASTGCLVAGVLVSMLLIMIIIADNRSHFSKSIYIIQKYDTLLADMERAPVSELKSYFDRSHAIRDLHLPIRERERLANQRDTKHDRHVTISNQRTSSAHSTRALAPLSQSGQPLLPSQTSLLPSRISDTSLSQNSDFTKELREIRNNRDAKNIPRSSSLNNKLSDLSSPTTAIRTGLSCCSNDAQTTQVLLNNQNENERK